MTNFEKWKAYMSWCISPESYIDWGYYYLIAAALQRRVWFGAKHIPLYPNMYVFLVGDAGLGKGLVINPVNEILAYHKLPDPNAAASNGKANTTDLEKQIEKEVAESNLKRAESAMNEFNSYDTNKKPSRASLERPPLIPVAPDATTYESLVTAMAKSTRYIKYKYFDDSIQKDVAGIYVHASLCFCLEEISSLFRKYTNDVVNFLVKVYDCHDYKKETKHSGKDLVINPCLNFFGGTTPDFMREIFSDELFNQGVSSRSFFIFAAKNRGREFLPPELTAEQLQYKKDIITHVEKLSRLYGPVTASPETMSFLREWWIKEETERSNKSIRLNCYYARKNIHLVKLAMALHFSESTEMEIAKETFERAIEILFKEEKNMHFALGLDENSPLTKIARKIEKYIIANPTGITKKELLAEFWDYLPDTQQEEGLVNILEGLKLKKVITEENAIHPKTKAPYILFKPIPR